MRVVLDSRLRLPRSSKLVRTAQGDVLVYTHAAADSPRARALKKAGVEVVRIRGRKNQIDLRAVVEDLGKREILSLMIEGGARVNGAALTAEVVDKVVLFYAPKLLGAEGVPIAAFSEKMPGSLPRRYKKKGQSMASLPPLRIHAMRRFGPDFMVEGYLRDVYRDH